MKMTMESSIDQTKLNYLEVNCPNADNKNNVRDINNEIGKDFSEKKNGIDSSPLNEEATLDRSDVNITHGTMKESNKDASCTNDTSADLETSEENIVLNDNTQSSDSGFPNGSLEKMSIIDEETKEAAKESRKIDQSLDSDDDSEPVITEMKVNSDEEATMLLKSHKACDMIVDDDDEDSNGGGTTSYETAGSSAGSQCDRPPPFRGTKSVENCSKQDSSSSDVGVSNSSRGRKRMNLRSRISSTSSSGSTETSSSSGSSSSSLDSDDDSKSSLNSSGPSVGTESWRKKNLLHELRKAKKATSAVNDSTFVEGQEGIDLESKKGESSKKYKQNHDNTEPNDENASSSTAPGRKKKKKKYKKRAKLEKRKKPSVSQSSNSSDAFVSLEDIPGSSELQDPGFRVLSSSTRENENNENIEVQPRDSDDEHLSDNAQSDSDDSLPNENGRQRHGSNSSSSSSSSNSDAILRQARFGPRNRMMRARIRAQEEAERENESESQRPPPEVLSKPSAKCKYSFFKDFIKRQYDSKPTHPWFIKNRIGSLDLIKRFELSQKLEGHEVSKIMSLLHLKLKVH